MDLLPLLHFEGFRTYYATRYTLQCEVLEDPRGLEGFGAAARDDRWDTRPLLRFGGWVVGLAVLKRMLHC